MKIAIRQGVFETNSSSMHSIVVKKEHSKECDSEYMGHIRLYDGKIEIWDPDDISFERYPFRFLRTFIEKLYYVLAEGNCAAKTTEEYEKWLEAEIYPILKKYIPAFVWIKFPEDMYNEDKLFYGYVDHQSQGLLTAFLKKYNLSIEDFLVDSAYIIVIDGDEYCNLKNMIRDGILNLNNIQIIEGIYGAEYEK